MTDLCDELLAEKFRREFSEQFQILVRMHLSFVLDLSTEDSECSNDKPKTKKWKVVPFGKKWKQTNSQEGTSLSEVTGQIYQLIAFLEEEQNLKVEGIFRRTGSLSRQNELKNLLKEGNIIDFEKGDFSVHDCASVLKQFLSDLPEPLLTEYHFPAYCQIAELFGVVDKPIQEDKLLEALQLVLLLLPTENKSLFKDILKLLNLTATYESSNKMSEKNLATLFTPHLLCPRKMSAEKLHSNSQNLCGIIAFMIQHHEAVFKIPPKLILDFRVRFGKRILQPSVINESISDQYAANTVFTFLDHERTAKENESNPTETALAQLYAYIQSLPESTKKRKLVKQFNKENGHGTPLQVMQTIIPKHKSLGESIKKHLLSRKLIRNTKKPSFSQVRSSSEEVLNSPSPSILSKARLFCTNCDPSPEKFNENEVMFSERAGINANHKTSSEVLNEENRLRKSFSEPNLIDESDSDFEHQSYLTSTPAYIPLHSCKDVLFTPERTGRNSMSPITKSTQRMTRAMQETMMTPRSRKPVLLISGNTLNNIQGIEPNQSILGLSEANGINVSHNISEDSLTSTFCNYLNSRKMLMCSGSLKDSSFSSRTDDFTSNSLDDLSEEKLTESLLYCLNGNDPNCDEQNKSISDEKELILKPKQFDENGQPTVFETSF